MQVNNSVEEFDPNNVAKTTIDFKIAKDTAKKRISNLENQLRSIMPLLNKHDAEHRTTNFLMAAGLSCKLSEAVRFYTLVFGEIKYDSGLTEQLRNYEDIRREDDPAR